MSDLDIIQQPLVNAYKWYRSNKCHVAVMIAKVPLEKLRGALVKVWCHRETCRVIHHQLKCDDEVALCLSLTETVQSDVFEKMTLKYYEASGCLYIQLPAKKKSKAEKENRFYIELDLGDGCFLQSSYFQVKSKFKGFTVQQVNTHCSSVKAWHRQVEAALQQGQTPLPTLRIDILESLRDVATQIRRRGSDSTDSLNEEQSQPELQVLGEFGDEMLSYQTSFFEDTPVSPSLSEGDDELNNNLQEFSLRRSRSDSSDFLMEEQPVQKRQLVTGKIVGGTFSYQANVSEDAPLLSPTPCEEDDGMHDVFVPFDEDLGCCITDSLELIWDGFDQFPDDKPVKDVSDKQGEEIFKE